MNGNWRAFGQQYFANITVASPPCTNFNHGRLGTSLRRLMDLPWTQKAAFSCRYFYGRYFLWQVLLSQVFFIEGTFYGRYFCIDLEGPYIRKARVPGVLTLRYTHIHYIFMIYAFFFQKFDVAKVLGQKVDSFNLLLLNC